MDGIDNGCAGDCRTGHGFNVVERYVKRFPDKLGSKVIFHGTLAEAFGLIGRAHGKGSNLACIIQYDRYIDSACKPLCGTLQGCTGKNFGCLRRGCIDGVNDRIRGDRGTGKGVDGVCRHRNRLPDELIGKRAFHGTLAQPFRLGGGVNGKACDRQIVSQCDFHLDVAPKALGTACENGAGHQGGGVDRCGFRSCFLAKDNGLCLGFKHGVCKGGQCAVGGSQYGIACKGGTAQCFKTAAGRTQTGELFRKGRLKGTGTDAVGFQEVCIANMRADNGSLRVQSEGNGDRSCIALLTGGYTVTDNIAVFIQRFIQTGDILVGRCVIAYGLIVGGRQDTVICFLQSSHAVLFNGAGGDHIGQRKHERRSQGNQCQDHKRGKLLLCHLRQPPHVD